MNLKRTAILYGFLLLAMTAVLGRVYLIAQNAGYARKANDQTITDLSLPEKRGDFYDRNGKQLTGFQPEYYALCIPGESSYTRLFHAVDYTTQAGLYQRRNSAAPFLIPVTKDLSQTGIFCYRSERRYSDNPIAQHLMGYLDGKNCGVAGLELLYEESLHGTGEHAVVQCVTNASGGLMIGTEPNLLEPKSQNEIGVQLTIDEGLQRECEGIADLTMERGCIVVLDTESGQILASVSRPEFSQRNIGKAIAADDTSLINRAFSQFSVGSVFKPIVAAAALEHGLGWFTWECEGSVEVDGLTFRCAKGIAHGEMNLQGALEQSCNCYFIQLGLQLGRDKLLEMAGRMGLGKPLTLSGLGNAAGYLPASDTLIQLGQLANFSFGQGQLMATPIQIAAMMNIIANGGSFIQPSAVLRTMNVTTGETVKAEPSAVRRRALTERQAESLRRMLCGVVEGGIGRKAKPSHLGAGGKTGTAQTGRFDPDGAEYMNYWFAGFYPADNPRYTIVVLQDETVEPRVSCGEIFSGICAGLYYGTDLQQKKR